MLQPFSFEVSDDTIAVTTGTAKVTYRMPLPFQLVEVSASLTVPQSSGSALTVDINKGGVSILSTKLRFDNGDKTTRTAATPAVLSGGMFDLDDELTIDVDQIGDGTAKGLKVTLLGYQAVQSLGTAPPPSGPTETLVDRSTGTAYGDMTVFGLSKAFDGLTNSVGTSCAAKSSLGGYVGQSFSAGKVFSKAIVHGANDRGFLDGSNGSCTIDIYGKNGTPSGATDGTLLGTLTFTDTGDESAGREIALTNSTAFTHCHARINGGAFSTYCAELRLYELV